MLTTLFVSLLSVPMGGPVQKSPDISAIAPYDSALVVGIADCAALRASFEDGTMGRLRRDAEMKAFIDGVLDESLKPFQERVGAAGVKTEDLDFPIGPAGLSLFTTTVEEERRWHFLFMADYADKAGEMAEAFEKIIDHELEQGTIELKEDELKGAKIWTITLLKEPDAEEPGAAAGDEPDDPMGDEDLPPGMEDFDFDDFEPPPGPFDHVDTITLARLGGVFFLSSSAETLESAIMAAGGADQRTIADNPAFQQALEQHPAGVQAYAVGLAEPVLPDIDEAMGALPFFLPVPFDADFAGLLGLDKVRSVSIGVSLETAQAASELSLGVVMPEKTGLFSLFTKASGAFDPPSFVHPDAATIARYTIDFPAIIKLADDFVASLPEDERAQARAGLDQAMEVARPVLENIGPELYVMSSYDQPLTSASEQVLTVLPVKDQLIISNLLTTFAAELGFEAGDFEGNTIFRGQDAIPLAIGLGFGHAFVGPPTAVENAMRAAGNPAGPRLATEPKFREAVALMRSSSIMAWFVDIEQSLKWSAFQAAETRKMMEEWAKEAGEEFDPADAGMVGGLTGQVPPADIVARYLGDVIFDLEPTPEGYRGKALWLRRSSR